MALDLTGIDNVGDFYSPHYLDAVLDSDLKSHFARWTERGADSPERRLARLADPWFKALAELELARDPEERMDLARAFHGELFAALGYEPRVAVAEADEGIDVPLWCDSRRDGRPFLWLVEVPPYAAEDGDPDPLGPGPLGSQYPEAGEGEAWSMPETSWRELLDGAVFRGEKPPRWVLAANLRELYLIDGHKWGQGRHLHFDLEELFRRKDPKALRAMAGLLHREIINPDDGLCVHDSLDENSHKHAYAVSTDLKKGAREAIELIANEAITYKRKTSHQGVFSGDLSEDLANTIKTESITYLYRLIFLFYVEARSEELGVVPMKSEEYRQGYSLEALRELELVPLTTPEAQNGFFIHDSLEILFRLVNKGFGVGAQRTIIEAESHRHGFSIDALRSPLFDPGRTPILSAVKLRNSVLQKVLELLSLSRPKKGKKSRRGRISYAQLGINQLGAVYEGLLAYSGFFARDTVYEVRHPREMKDEDPRSWFVPESEIGQYRDEEVVKEEGKRVRYPKGHFLFRLTGRDREKSASYYTPEVLTRCLVKYTLKERFKSVKSADEILDLTVCEPAMGSGAFLVEAVNQLAEAYLVRKQAERGERISSERYQHELQKVKRHITVHSCYGVDLNPMAAELGKLSLWLNCLFRGARAPYLELNIACGNSLIGARREVYRPSELLEAKGKKKADYWFSKAPERVEPGAERPADSVYHFLLPFHEMAPFDKDKVIKGLLPEPVAAIKKWRKAFVQPLNPMDLQELQRLSGVVDELWARHIKERQRIKAEIAEPSRLWGQPVSARAPSLKFDACAEAARGLGGDEAPGRRLKRLMDYWCALWFWPLLSAKALPTWAEWLAEVKAILEGPIEDSERLSVVEGVVERMPFFHWELVFGELFEGRGGFDVIVGNPPWIRPEFRGLSILSDLAPVLVIRELNDTAAEGIKNQALRVDRGRSLYLTEFETVFSQVSYLGACCNYLDLAGIQSNFYKCFIDRCFDLLRGNGVCGFFHQPSIFDDSKGGRFRGKLYRKLVLLAKFKNELLLFEMIGHPLPYCFSVFSGAKVGDIHFLLLSNILHPRTIDETLEHDGVGAVPGIKTSSGAWDLRGHLSRAIELTPKELRDICQLYDLPGTHYTEARIPEIHSREVLAVIEKLSHTNNRIGDISEGYLSTVCFDETSARRNGIIKRSVDYPRSTGDLVISGPHFYVAQPYSKNPRENCKSKGDYETLRLDLLPRNYLPRSIYTKACDSKSYSEAMPSWRGRPFNNYYRHIHRRRVNRTMERTLIPCLIPPGPTHIHSVLSITISDPWLLCLVSGYCSSIVYDFYIKSTGKGDVYNDTFSRLPLPLDRRVGTRVVMRALRLNCLTGHYADLWASVFDECLRSDCFSKTDDRLFDWSRLSSSWSEDSPLRAAFERRQALVEIDALAAIALEITPEELCAVYRAQFPVLQQYEADTWYDRRGMIVFTNNRGLSDVGLSRKEWEEIRHAKAGETLPDFAREYIPPFDRCDREEDMRQAYAHFEKILKEEGEL